MLPGLGSLVYILTGSKALLPWQETVEDEQQRRADPPDYKSDYKPRR